MSTKKSTKTINFDEKKYSLNEIAKFYYDYYIEDGYNDADANDEVESVIYAIIKKPVNIHIDRVVRLKLNR